MTVSAAEGCLVAERLQVPLLFVGNDFSHTDLEVAL
jgi:uncharacterized protein with PIN domain